MDLDKQQKAIFQAVAKAAPKDRKTVAAGLIADYPGDDKWIVERSVKDFMRELEGEEKGSAIGRANRFTWSAKDIDSLTIDNSEAVGEPFKLSPDEAKQRDDE
ncbi:hypothetical protein [Aliiroseovarius crassostreae]|uniref:hypothetical protein n=1 Tax=Aliiroseovarius crassostreae TaxID=154981 RepID=UPI00220E4707|nr:hypothetical protein [Aliiroseovarius crassostreae]UWQ07924.1 hypothetical protein K3X25_14510 [Aliiroseovarius crassostreae]